jgi:GT2 family glycosyltransferase/tetratricopeptide (TPR) repeat protein
VLANPWDRPAARALAQALADVGDLPGRAAFVQVQRQLHEAAPQMVPAEDWFTQPRPTGRELASVIILCCNEIAFTRLCLDSVLRHTRPPFELILVDNGSTDGTGEYLQQLTDHPSPERVEVIRNATNRGFPAGVNQGLAVARGEYLVLLNNDTVVTPRWLDGLVRTAAGDWPAVGMCGPVSNFAGGVQQVPVPEECSPDQIAARRHIEYIGRTREAPMLSGFCLLIRRDVLAAVGGLDERFGLGFFDDDDLSRRVKQAGFRLAVADGVYVHHFGSRTFLGLGIDTARQLRDNHALFRAKWEGGPAPARPDSPVSLTMIVRDEEANLDACLGPLRDLVGEMVVVDTGSTDRTKEVAARLGARVFDFPWVDDFAAARNEALRHATRPWVFWVDADDRVDADGVDRLKSLFAGLRDENAAYVLKCVCVPDVPGGAATVVDHVRLFRNDPRVRWRYRVHEQILPALRAVGADVRWGDVRIHHVGYVDPAVRARKRERDTRLLRAELDANPDDPFALFNLGAVLHERGEWAEAAGVLERSLRLSHPRDSIVRKLFALIAQCQSRLGDRSRAVTTCGAGREHYPDDAELLFLEANLHKETGNLAAAEHLYRRLLTGRDDPHFASVDTGLRGHKARHNLALVYLQLGRALEAAELLQAAVAEEPAFLPSWYALADLAVRAGDWAECERIADRVRPLGPDGEVEAERLTAEVLAGQGEVVLALRRLEQAVERHPQALPLRLIESRLRVQDGSDPAAAERAVRAVLALAPDHPAAYRDMERLRRTGRPSDAEDR